MNRRSLARRQKRDRMAVFYAIVRRRAERRSREVQMHLFAFQNALSRSIIYGGPVTVTEADRLAVQAAP